MLANLSCSLQHLTGAQQCDLEVLVGQYYCLFSDVPIRTSVLKHDIEIKDARPIKQHAYCANQTEHQLMKQEVEYLLQNDSASASSSPWSSPCLLDHRLSQTSAK